MPTLWVSKSSTLASLVQHRDAEAHTHTLPVTLSNTPTHLASFVQYHDAEALPLQTRLARAVAGSHHHLQQWSGRSGGLGG